MARKTPLNATHRASGARMVDFGGWEMPLHYGSQVEEHHAVRGDAGLFDVSHMRVVDVEGPDARAFLRRALANDVAKLRTPGRALYSCLLADDGGVIDDLIAYFLAEDRFRCVVNAGTADKDIAWLEALAARFAARVRIVPRAGLALVAIQGPRARERFWAAHPELRAATESLEPFHAATVGDAMVARTGYTGEDGFEVFVDWERGAEIWNALAAAGKSEDVLPCGLGARDTLRLEAGMPLYGNELDRQTNPFDAGLGRVVKLDKPGGFVGRDALAKVAADGPAKRLVGLAITGRGIARHGYPVDAGERKTGIVTSGTMSPSLGHPIAMAYVAPGDGEPGTILNVEIREQPVSAEVVPLPFYKRDR